MGRTLKTALGGIVVMALLSACSGKNSETAASQPKPDSSKASKKASQKSAVQKRQSQPKKIAYCQNYVLRRDCILQVRVVGQGVAPVHTVSPAQAQVLAKRAAIVDGYRQLGEKIYGVQVEGRDTVQNMMIRRSVIHTHLNTLIQGAKILDEEMKDGLYQVEMEVTMDGRRWYPLIVGN